MKILSTLLALLGLIAAPLGAADACCAPQTAAAKSAPDACCAADALATDAPLSANSLYALDATFTDDAGHPVALASLRGHPVVLTMFFASCGYACPLLVSDMTRVRDALPAELRADTRFVLVSFDVARDTPAALHDYRTTRQLDNAWTLLHGDDDAVRELAALLGVKYKPEANGSFAHSNLITILNREGEIVHQRTGLKGGLGEATAALAALR
jgi:protein SCO1/2